MTQWKTGLFDCFDDVQLCLLGWCCSCYVFGQNAEQITGEEKIPSCVKFALLSYCCLGCLIHKPQRQALRSAYNLEENPSDFISTCICSSCANCQEARELKLRGVAPGTRITSQPR